MSGHATKKNARAVSASAVKEQRNVASASLANLKPFQPGQSGNSKGRQKGSRNKLGEEFLTDMLTVWREVGEDCIRRTAAEHPEKLVSIMAGILPKELNVNTNPLEELSDDELEECIHWLRHYIRTQTGDPDGGAPGDDETKH